MRFLMPFMFVLFALVGGVGVLVLNSGSTLGATASTGKPASADDAQAEAPSGQANGLSVLLAMFSGEEVAAPPAPDLTGALAPYLPQAGLGWTREPYTLAHGEALTEATYQRSAVVISTTNSLLSEFERARKDANGVAATYRKGDEVVAVSITTRTNRDMRSLQGSIMTAIAGNINGATSFGNRPSGFGNVDGVNFAFGGSYSTVMATRVEVPIRYRTLSATLGGQVSIRVMTNASDAAIAEIISGIDMPGLNATLHSPDLVVTAGTGLITSQLEALSTLPPEPSLQYKAFQRLRTDVSTLSQDDVRLLQTLAAGDIKGWIDIYENYGLNYRLSPEMAEILGDKPTLSAIDQVRFEAMAMLQNPAVLARYEIDIVKGLSKGRYETREAAQRQLSETRLYGPPLIRLINKLPLAPVEEVVAPQAGVDDSYVTTSTEPREIVVRRGITVQQGDVMGADCAIELGVRRCTVEDSSE